MPWKQRTAVDERKAFVRAFERKELSFSALCRHFGISRPTGYKWLQRHTEGGDSNLADQSRAPLCSRGTPEPMVSAILALRQQHPTWGPKKLLKILETQDPHFALAAS